jgi:hypothetical protein
MLSFEEEPAAEKPQEEPVAEKKAEKAPAPKKKTTKSKSQK